MNTTCTTFFGNFESLNFKFKKNRFQANRWRVCQLIRRDWIRSIWKCVTCESDTPLGDATNVSHCVNSCVTALLVLE